LSLSTLDTSTTGTGFSVGAAPDYATLLSGTSATASTPVSTPPPAPGDPNWAAYWQQKDPQAWSLVWDSQVPKDKTSIDKTFTGNLKSGQPVYFSFDVKDSQAEYKKYLVPMTEEQKANTRKALQELSNVTGVKFVEKTGVKGGLVLAQADLSSGSDKESTMGQHQGATLTVLDAKGNKTEQYQQTVMVNKWIYSNKSLAPGTSGFETLLHELGHAAGLDDAKFELGKKYPQYDDTKYTLMSYDDAEGKNRTTYGELDRRAFEALYPSDKRPVTPPVVVSAGTRTLLSAAGASLEDELFAEDDATASEAEEEWEHLEYLAENSSSPSGAGQDQETVVAVEEGPTEYKTSPTGSAGFALGTPDGALNWPGQVDPALLLATTPAMGGTAALVGTVPDMFAGADALKRVLAQG